MIRKILSKDRPHDDDSYYLRGCFARSSGTRLGTIPPLISQDYYGTCCHLDRFSCLHEARAAGEQAAHDRGCQVQDYYLLVCK